MASPCTHQHVASTAVLAGCSIQYAVCSELSVGTHCCKHGSHTECCWSSLQDVQHLSPQQRQQLETAVREVTAALRSHQEKADAAMRALLVCKRNTCTRSCQCFTRYYEAATVFTIGKPHGITSQLPPPSVVPASHVDCSENASPMGSAPCLQAEAQGQKQLANATRRKGSGQRAVRQVAAAAPSGAAEVPPSAPRCPLIKCPLSGVR